MPKESTMHSLTAAVSVILVALAAVAVAQDAPKSNSGKGQLNATPERNDSLFRQAAAVFERHCVRCHQGAKSAGRLALTTAKSALAGGESGLAIMPGKADKSLLVKYISGNAPAMPKEGDRLPPQYVETIRRWIDAGAPWPTDVTLTEKLWTKSKVKVLDANTLLLEDGTKYELTTVAPDLDQMAMIDGNLYPAGEEAAGFLRKLIGDQPVLCFDKIAYVGDKNIIHELVINGWSMRHHSSTIPAQIIAREKKRGLWRGRFVEPIDWRAGVRLPGEPPPPRLDERQAVALLQRYGMRDTALPTVLARIVKDLPRTRRLDLYRTVLTDDQLAQLVSLSELEKLSVGWGVTDAGLAHLKALPRLRHLNLHYKKITDAGLKHLAHVTQLQELVLSNTLITDAGLKHLKGLERLRYLDLSRNELTDAALRELCSLKSLKALALARTRITDTGLVQIKELSNLEYLDVSGTEVTENGIEPLIGLNRLRVLKVPDRVSGKARSRLRGTLPSLEFDGLPDDVLSTSKGEEKR
jgi:endonuclease YncB( thermonuclease family)